MWPSSSLSEALAAAGRGAISFLYPPRCYICSAPLLAPSVLCESCFSGLERSGKSLCAVCGVPVPEGIDLCRDCAVEPRPFSRARAVGPYAGALRVLVLGLKYDGEPILARFLASFLAEHFPEGAELITYVPEDPGRKRPHNAAELLARALSRLVGVPVEGLLKKVRSTPPQVGLSFEERKENLAGAFAALRRGRGERVALIDDIYTTGSTVSECAKALLEADFGEVVVLTAAHTLPGDAD